MRYILRNVTHLITYITEVTCKLHVKIQNVIHPPQYNLQHVAGFIVIVLWGTAPDCRSYSGSLPWNMMPYMCHA
jgi:hypothetical protein